MGKQYNKKERVEELKSQRKNEIKIQELEKDRDNLKTSLLETQNALNSFLGV